METFTPSERALLAPHFSNVDGPVFALVDLPETVKAAMFARYSRYPGTLRRLFLDEFAETLPGGAGVGADVEGARAAELFERIFVGYGDDSVAQLGGMHVAVEWCSNVLTKVLQRPRLAGYLEQSTRYIAYDAPMPGGGYRYYRDEALGPEYVASMDFLFDAYSRALPQVSAWVDASYPVSAGEPEAARKRAVKAKALDLLRGLLPAASLSHMGIYASGQAYEQLIMHLLAHPLPEARLCGQRMLEAVKAVIPSFVSRVEREGRGDVWIGYLGERRAAEQRWVERLGLDRDEAAEERSSVRLIHVDGDENQLLAALLFEGAGVPEERTLAAVADMTDEARAAMLGELVGERTNRRHRPGRGFEALRYRFEIVSDYGAFRDLQRHRMLTVQWQSLTPDLGAEVPEEVVAAGCGDLYAEALDRSRAEYERLREAGLSEAAPYALCLGYRIRYLLDLNAREAMHLTELRSAREGHSSYRAVAQAMHSAIAEVHPAVAATMKHVDHSTEPRLERILAEIRGESRREPLTA
ncbi:FAD-dependent thymidylate synthase [Solirubrobacter phytolaccae]|uniref:FAD-dependent thymidylate synthase n=1 Tax=Solirubrobacter phytolaccae TaxID=1404360 RepID=A0A9X3N320_9ACTN|nr:FAD-dependent thymidylate synthase [Solirubrobacter phytolaccae]MDA0178900.1 FAD-dependent thymidylate synthase [Solirubrobacter phytolaccae]